VSYRQTLYTPIVTLWAWMSQVLALTQAKQCRQPNLAWLATAGETVPQQTPELQQSSQTLSLTQFQPLLKQTADSSNGGEAGATVVRTTVKAYDGTTVLMSDTIANQQSYPQHSNQKSDVAFR